MTRHSCFRDSSGSCGHQASVAGFFPPLYTRRRAGIMSPPGVAAVITASFSISIMKEHSGNAAPIVHPSAMAFDSSPASLHRPPLWTGHPFAASVSPSSPMYVFIGMASHLCCPAAQGCRRDESKLTNLTFAAKRPEMPPSYEIRKQGNHVRH